MANFDAINTRGASLDELEPIALAAERSRDFSSSWQEHSVGLSTGTSGSRGLFLVSPQERARWVGTMLGRLLGGRLLARERIALVLRAGNTLYDSIGALRLAFRWFDPARPWDETRDALIAFDPTIVVAPAQVLARLATERHRPKPARVISVAEVLDPLDREVIETAFDARVEQIYQATEGFLGATCEAGTLHLNEPFVQVEREWQDAARTRFVPIVTDLWRQAQPVIRYRLDDVLQVASAPCVCGRVATALAGIEGRRDDVLWLGGRGADIAVFPDLVTRAIVRTVTPLEDYEVTATAPGRWRVSLRPLPDAASIVLLRATLRDLALGLGAEAPEVSVAALATFQPGVSKRRRVRGLEIPCAS